MFYALRVGTSVALKPLTTTMSAREATSRDKSAPSMGLRQTEENKRE